MTWRAWPHPLPPHASSLPPLLPLTNNHISHKPQNNDTRRDSIPHVLTAPLTPPMPHPSHASSLSRLPMLHPAHTPHPSHASFLSSLSWLIPLMLPIPPMLFSSLFSQAPANFHPGLLTNPSKSLLRDPDTHFLTAPHVLKE